MVAVPNGTVAPVTGIETNFVNLRRQGSAFLPASIAVIGQGTTAATFSTTKAQVTSAYEVGSTYGFGSPLHLAAMSLFPLSGGGVGTIPVTVFPLDDDGAGVAATGSITPSGAATGSGSFVVRINNIDSAEFAVASGQSVATQVASIVTALASELYLPMLGANGTTDVDLTAKWKGSSGNDLFIEVVATSADNTGVTYAVVQPSGGLINPDTATATNQISQENWYTHVVSCFQMSDTALNDDLEDFFEGKWDPLVRTPGFVFVGLDETTVATATALTSPRKAERVISLIAVQGGNDLPLKIAAEAVREIAVIANNNPPQAYARLKLSGLNPGLDSQQWTHTQRDVALKGGVSTTRVLNGGVTLDKVVTTYAPLGDPAPAYRSVEKVWRQMNVIYNLALIFDSDEWSGAPLLPGSQPTTNPTAKTEAMAIAEIATMHESLAANAIIVDLAFAKANISAVIDSVNPDRINISTTYKLSGNADIKSIVTNFGFYTS